MMTLTDNRIDALVRRIRAYPAVSDFVFMKAYPPRELPNPIRKYTVTVANTGVKVARWFIGGAAAENGGRIFETYVVMRVYAPDITSGSALLRASALLATAAELADTDRMIDEISLSGIAYDTAARTNYRDVRLRLYTVSCEEAEDD